MKRVLLHTCCAPCSGAIIEWMLANGWQPTIYYCNPNIYPEEEYCIRKDECSRYARELGLKIVDADYDHDSWLEAVRGLEGEPERGGRCLQCFRLRLLRTARYALENGFGIMTTTLMSSRWKSLDQINEAGRWAVAQALSELEGSDGELRKAAGSGDCHERPEGGQEAGMTADAPKLEWWDRNWRKGGLQQRRQEIIRERNFYNQLYCGCEFSIRQSSSSSGAGVKPEGRVEA